MPNCLWQLGDLIVKLLITRYTPYCCINNIIALYFCSVLHKCWYCQLFWFPQLMFNLFWGRKPVEIERLILDPHSVLPVSYQLTPPFLSFQTKVCYFSNVYLQDQKSTFWKKYLSLLVPYSDHLPSFVPKLLSEYNPFSNG